ncbi:hypothetical protein CHELA1G11_12342 [Hyphomicrobiales bacterium]|nr:hypothetical protein CHELA1G2_11968 [Hyphomicrobiales bacterium]CAH1664173.1 hypothetical protein CHELA1G11_12342 [Hyphomicrobiales bacterium]
MKGQVSNSRLGQPAGDDMPTFLMCFLLVLAEKETAFSLSPTAP